MTHMNLESHSWEDATDIEQYLVIIREMLPKTTPSEIILPTREDNSRADTR